MTDEEAKLDDDAKSERKADRMPGAFLSRFLPRPPDATLVIASIVVVYAACVAGILYRSDKSLVELELNALGDFLAGAFAPLAFLLLACAVWLQRLDLQTLREEQLENRKLVAAQVAESRRQAENMASQTAFLEESMIAKRQIAESHRFELLVRQIVFSIRRNFGQKLITRYATDERQIDPPLADTAEDFEDPVDALLEVTRRLVQVHGQVCLLGTRLEQGLQHRSLLGLKARLEMLAEYDANVMSHHQMAIKVFTNPDTIMALDELIELVAPRKP